MLKFLQLEQTVKDLGEKCISAVEKLQENLRAKESNLANYLRMDIGNCMDSCTTSPVESANSAIKHGPHKVNVNMNLDRVTKKMIQGVKTSLNWRKNRAHREENKSNQASCAPTKEFIIKKGQGLIDRAYDARHD